MLESTDKKPFRKIKEAAQRLAREASTSAAMRRYQTILFLGVLILIAGGFGVLTFLVKTTPSFATDLLITRDVQLINFPTFAWLMTAISWLGFGPQVVIITVLILLLIYLFGLHWEAVAALVAALLPLGVNVLVKDLVGRPRPAADLVNVVARLNDYSFPSGHVMFYLGFFGFVGFLVFSLLKPSPKRNVLLVLIGIPVIFIGISRIYLGQHWASDVLGAYLLGTLTLMANIQFYRWGKTRFFVRQPVAGLTGSSQQA